MAAPELAIRAWVSSMIASRCATTVRPRRTAARNAGSRRA
jgi:hypothetical protein